MAYIITILPRIEGVFLGFMLLICLGACGNDIQDRPVLSVTPFPTVQFTTPASTTSVSPGGLASAISSGQPSLTVTVTPDSPVSQPKLVGTTNLTANGPGVVVQSPPDETPRLVGTTPSSPSITVNSPVANARTGLVRGHVTSEPGCPVARAGNPCPALAVANRKVQIEDPTQTNTIKTLTTDTNGYFTVELAPGNYIVEVAPGTNSVERRKPYPVVVVVGQTFPLEIILDSGIR